MIMLENQHRTVSRGEACLETKGECIRQLSHGPFRWHDSLGGKLNVITKAGWGKSRMVIRLEYQV